MPVHFYWLVFSHMAPIPFLGSSTLSFEKRNQGFQVAAKKSVVHYASNS